MSRNNRTKKPSPSARLRNALYHLWEKEPDGHEEFDSFYEDRINKLINWIKSK